MTAKEGERPTILHPTDFGREGNLAFAHALKIALRLHGSLSLLHLQTADALEPKVSAVKRALDTLAAWKLLPAGADETELERRLDVKLAGFSLPARNAREGILDYIEDHACDLAVLASRKRKGLQHWLDPSVAEKAVKRARTMILFLREGVRGFVSPSGMIGLRNVLVPLDERLDAEAAIRRIETFANKMSQGVALHFLHVGPKAPAASAHKLILRDGPVVETIIDQAERLSADLIAVPTGGHSGLLGALRGSVTAKILDESRWPVLSVPAHS